MTERSSVEGGTGGSREASRTPDVVPAPASPEVHSAPTAAAEHDAGHTPEAAEATREADEARAHREEAEARAPGGPSAPAMSDAAVSAEVARWIKTTEESIKTSAPETAVVTSAKDKLAEALPGMHSEESVLKRRSKYKALEATLVAAVEKQDDAVEKGVVEEIGRLNENEKRDFDNLYGSVEGWKKQYRAERQMAREKAHYLFAPKEPKKEAHGHGEHGHGHDDHGHHEKPKPDPLVKTLENDLIIRVKAVNAHFAKEKKTIAEQLAAGKMTQAQADKKLFWLKFHHARLGFPTTLTKTSLYAAGVAAVPAIAIGLTLWDITGLPGFKMARTELANWVNWVLHAVELPWQIPTGEDKKGGGGHGGGH